MKWSWKSFSLQFALTLVAAFAISFILGHLIDPQQVPVGSDLTRFSMAMGGFLAPLLLSALSGWKLWNRKMLFVITLVVSVLHSGSPGAVMLTLLAVSVMYFLTAKIHNLVLYYTLPGTAAEPE